MRTRRTVALLAAGWVVVAAAGATLVWGVISRAGDGVSGGIDALASSPGPSLAPGDPPTISRSPSPTTPAPTDPSDSGAEPGVTPVTGTWEGVSGVVTVACRGSAVSLTSTTWYSGFVGEIDDEGPDRVRVEFESDESRIRVEAECVNGEPVFEEDGSGED